MPPQIPNEITDIQINNDYTVLLTTADGIVLEIALEVLLVQYTPHHINIIQLLQKTQGEKELTLIKIINTYQNALIALQKTHNTFSIHTGQGDIIWGDKIINNHYFTQIIPPNKQLNKIPKITPPKIIGRDKDVQQVRLLLQEKNALVIVNGLGGMGKTVLSHYYWQQYQVQYKHLLWLSGEGDLESDILFDSLLHKNLKITDQLAPYLEALKTPNNAEARQQALALIHHALATLDQPCLMMIDNADEKNFWTIKEWAENFPNFHILITSRNEMTDVYTHFLEGVSEPDALTLFYLYYDLEEKRPHNDTLVAQICKAAGYHTLTIELLAKTLRNRHDLTYQSLLTELDQHIVYLKKKIPIDTNYNKSRDYIDGILEFCFSLSKLQDNPAALYILMNFSVLPSYNVKAEHLRIMLSVTEENKTEHEQTKQVLIQSGWIQYYLEDDYYYNCHAVVQEVVRKKLEVNSYACNDIICFLGQKIYEINQINPLEATEWLPYSESILQKLSDKTNQIAVLANNLSIVYDTMGNLIKNLEYASKDLTICESNLPSDHPALAISYDNIASTYISLGDLSQSFYFRLKALQIFEKVLPARHPTLAISYDNIANNYKKMGDFPKGLEYGLKALDIQEKALPRNHSKLASIYNNIAHTYQLIGDLHKSVIYCTKALKIRERILPPSHPDLASSYFSLCQIYRITGDFPQSINYGLKALKIQEKIFDSQHPQLASSYNNIAETYKSIGNFEKSLELELMALHIQEKIFSPQHSALATSYNNIATTYSEMGELSQSLIYYFKALQILEKIFSSEHPDIASCYSNIGQIYRITGDLSQSLSYELKALQIFEKIFPPVHLSLATSYSNLGEIYKSIGDLSTSLLYSLKALQIKEKIFSSEHPSLADAYDNISERYRDIGNFQRSLEYGLKALDIQEKTQLPNYLTLAKLYNNLANTYRTIGDLHKGLSYGLKALYIHEKKYSSQHPNLIAYYNDVSLSYLFIGDLSNSLSYGLKALQICKKILSLEHPFITTTYSNIGETYRAMGNLSKSLEYGLKALNIGEKVYPYNHPYLATIYHNLALTYKTMNDLTKSLEYGLIALNIREKTLSNNHPDLASSYNNIGNIYYVIEDLPKSLEYGLKALKIYKNIFSPKHPDLATIYHNIANTYFDLSDWEKTLSFEQKALNIFLEILPFGHNTKAVVNIMMNRLFRAIEAKGEEWAKPYIFWFMENCRIYFEDEDSMDEDSMDEDSMDEDNMDEDNMDEDSMDEDSMDEDSMDEDSMDEDSVYEEFRRTQNIIKELRTKAKLYEAIDEIIEEILDFYGVSPQNGQIYVEFRDNLLNLFDEYMKDAILNNLPDNETDAYINILNLNSEEELALFYQRVLPFPIMTRIMEKEMIAFKSRFIQ